MFDAIVIGAGASGSHVAERLSRRGHRVAIVEKKAAAGVDVCCTGIVGRECFDLLHRCFAAPGPHLSSTHAVMAGSRTNGATNGSHAPCSPGLAPLLHRVSSAARFFMPSGRSIHLERPEPVAYILDRAALDQALLERARHAGAEHLCRTQVTRLEHAERHVRLEAVTDGHARVLEARTVIIATGYGSVLPGSLSLGRISDCLIGAQAEVETGIDEVEVYVDQELAPGGFAWLVPTRDGRGLAGIVTRRQHEQRLTMLLERLRARGRIASTACCRSYGAIPIRPRPRTFADRVLVVGDAAGQVKPTTGGGIYYGLLCGDIAADVLHDGLRTGQLSARHLATYQHRWQSRLGKELNIGYLTHRLWRRIGNREVELLFDLAVGAGLRELVASSSRFSFDWHAPMLLQLAGVLPFTSHGLELQSARAV